MPFSNEHHHESTEWSNLLKHMVCRSAGEKFVDGNMYSTSTPEKQNKQLLEFYKNIQGGIGKLTYINVKIANNTAAIR